MADKHDMKITLDYTIELLLKKSREALLDTDGDPDAALMYAISAAHLGSDEARDFLLEQAETLEDDHVGYDVAVRFLRTAKQLGLPVNDVGDTWVTVGKKAESHALFSEAMQEAIDNRATITNVGRAYLQRASSTHFSETEYVLEFVGRAHELGILPKPCALTLLSKAKKTDSASEAEVYTRAAAEVLELHTSS